MSSREIWFMRRGGYGVLPVHWKGVLLMFGTGLAWAAIGLSGLWLLPALGRPDLVWAPFLLIPLTIVALIYLIERHTRVQWNDRAPHR
jgi:hypothetical protein